MKGKKLGVVLLAFAMLVTLMPVMSVSAVTTLTTVDVGDINDPTAGPVSDYKDFTGTRDDGFTVRNDLCYWVDGDDQKVTEFVYGQSYWYTLVLQANEGYAFAEGVSLTIFGDEGNVEPLMTVDVTEDIATFYHAYKAICGGTLTNPTLTEATLSNKTFTYNGKVQTPTVTKIVDQNGEVIDAENYEVVYAEESSKNVGTYAITIRPVSYPYEGEITAYYQIIPKGTTISKTSAGKKKATISWKKQATQTKGYVIEYSTSKKFTNAKTKKITKTSTTKANLTGLTSGKTYYVRIYTYKGDLKSAASKAVKVKVK